MDNKNKIWLRISSLTPNSSFIIYLIIYFSYDYYLSLFFGKLEILNVLKNCILDRQAKTQFKTSTFGLLLLKIVVKMTFFSNEIPVLSRVLLILSAMLLPMLLYYFLVVGEGEKYTQ